MWGLLWVLVLDVQMTFWTIIVVQARLLLITRQFTMFLLFLHTLDDSHCVLNEILYMIWMIPIVFPRPLTGLLLFCGLLDVIATHFKSIDEVPIVFGLLGMTATYFQGIPIVFWVVGHYHY